MQFQKYISLFLFILFIGGISPRGTAGTPVSEETIITASRLPTPQQHTGSSTTVISTEDFGYTPMMMNTLSSVPGVYSNQHGGPGTMSYLSLRGTKPGHVLVLLDGIPLVDPSHTGRTFEIAHIPTPHVARIEVVRGPQSPLYGSDAIGGVIHIITEQPTNGFGMKGRLQAGGDSTFEESLAIFGRDRAITYYGSLYHIDSEGFSQTPSTYGGKEKDGYHNTSAWLRVGIHPNSHYGTDVLFRYTDAVSDLDQWQSDDPNHSQTNQTWLIGLHGFYVWNPDGDVPWTQNFRLSWVHQDRKVEDVKDERHDFVSTGEYLGEYLKAEWIHHIPYPTGHLLTVGVEAERNLATFASSFQGPDALSPPADDMGGAFVQSQWTRERLGSITVGGRIDYHNAYGVAPTYRISGILLSRWAHLKGSIGTGFKAPSLYQIYGIGGNSSLRPEHALGGDIGIEQFYWKQKIRINTTFFATHIEDLIDTKPKENFQYEYHNIAKMFSYGTESSILFAPSPKLHMRATHTFTVSQDLTQQKPKLRIPEHAWTFEVKTPLFQKGELRGALRYVGSRWDYPSILLPGYVLLHVSVSYPFGNHITAFARIDNILNTVYEPIAGYGAPGFAIYAGMEATI